jgi:hypothetical protein
MRVARSAHALLTWLFVAALFVQVFLAGLGVFDSFARFAIHRDVGYTLTLVPIVLLVLALVGRMGRQQVVLAAVIFLLFILQSVFVQVFRDAPLVQALHPVNGFIILGLAIALARASWASRGTGSALGAT